MNLMKLFNPFAALQLFTASFGGGGGGGTPQPTSQTVTQTNLPEYARPYFEDVLQRGQAASQVAYQPYGGERTAGFSPLQQQAFQGIAGLQPSAATSAGIDVAANVAQQAGQYGGYSPLQAQNLYQAPTLERQGISYLTAQAPELQQFQMGPAERVRTGAFNQPGVAGSYMSPYMQNVVDVQQREAQRQADIAKTQRGAQAAGAGAFGGSRQAIMEAEAARNLATQKGDIQATGLQSAYQQAQQAYQTDAARQLQARMANQQAGLQTGQQNLAALLGVQQLGAQTGMQAQQMNQAAQLQAQGQALGQSQALNQAQLQAAGTSAQYGLEGLRAAEQSRQFGAGLGLQGLQQQLAAAGQLGQLGQQQYGQEMGALQAQQQAGAQQQAQEQQRRDQAYEEFMRQQFYPQSQLQFYSSLLRGVPVSPQQTMYSYQAPPSMISQLGGLGLGAYGLSKMRAGGEVEGYAEGGEVKSYAVGGTTTGGYDAKIAEYTKYALAARNNPQQMEKLLSRLGPLERALVKERVQMMSGQLKNQEALQQGAPQRPVLESSGLAGLDAGVMENAEYAGGGIVAFAEGGQRGGRQDELSPEERERTERERASRQEFLYDLIKPVVRTGATIREGVNNLREAMRYGNEQAAFSLGLKDRLPEPPKPSGIPAIWGFEDRSPIVRDTPVPPAPTPVAQPAPAPEAAAPTPTTPAAKVKTETRPVAVRPGIRAEEDKPAAPAVAEEVPPKEIPLLDKDKEEAEYRKKVQEKFPSELQDRLAELQAQGQQALKDRDSDRWLAVAMGGFAAAAGQSPRALQNFAVGLGITTKEMQVINKDFRAAEEARRNAERAERRADRLEQLGMENAAYQVRQGVDKYNMQAQAANQKLASDLRQTRAYIGGTESRERVGMAEVAARNRATAEAAETRKEAREARTEQQRQAAENALGARIEKLLEGSRTNIDTERAKLAKLLGAVEQQGGTPNEQQDKNITKLKATIKQMETQYNKDYKDAYNRIKRESAAPSAAPSGGKVLRYDSSGKPIQ